jgi:hypothetical protein
MAKEIPLPGSAPPRGVETLCCHLWRAFQRGCSLFTMIVRPSRRTTLDPSFCFSDFSEFLTFIRASYPVGATAAGEQVFRRRRVPGSPAE